MVNRAAFLLRYKKPFVQWINAADPSGQEPPVSMEEANEDRTVYLIDEQDAENLDEWIALNYDVLFESELELWYRDESLWPPNRDLDLFAKWFSVECHTVLIDTGTGPIFDDEG